LSGFFEVLDDEINKRFKFHHLPHIFHCSLCQVWWFGLAYITCVGEFSLLNIAIVLVIAHLTELISPLFLLIKELIKKVISIISKFILN
jgi:hypothetical protein